MICSDLAYVIHARPYRETSQLLTVMARESGRLALVLKGVRSRKRLPAQPFSLLQLHWLGKTDLKTVKSIEATQHHRLVGRDLYIGLYLNELLMRLLREGQAATGIFDRYHHLLQRLHSHQDDVEPLLRAFEYTLITLMGYGFSLNTDVATGEAIEPHGYYRFDPLEGFSATLSHSGGKSPQRLYRGRHLLALAAMDYTDPEVKLAAKQLMREALQPHLGPKPLMSRELFRGYLGDAG